MRHPPRVSLSPNSVLAVSVFLVLLVTAIPTSAAWYLVPSQYETLGAAVDAAAPGDTIFVAMGTYTGDGNFGLNLIDKDLLLWSETGSANTIFDGEGEWNRRFATIKSRTRVGTVIRGFTFRNCNCAYGGVLRCESGTALALEDCVFEDNDSANLAGYDIWWAKGGAINATDTELTISDCDFTGNRAYNGGAISLYASSIEVIDSSFSDNVALVQYNYDSSSGGAIYARGGSSVIASGCEFDGNAASDSPFGESFGGAINHAGPVFSLEDCHFYGNVARYASAILVVACSGGVQLTDCTFYEGYGAVDIRSENSSITGCGFIHRGAPALTLASGDVVECLFTNCIGEPLKLTGATCTLQSCTISGNSGPVQCGSGSIEVDRTILALGGSEPIVGDGASVHHSLIFGNAAGDSLPGGYHDNLFTDPLFCDAASSDFSLCADSPCRPGGNPWYVRIGAFTHGCGPCDTAVEPLSWGRIKAMYR